LSIYTITMNPVLDIAGYVDTLIPNEKNYVKDEKKYPGGNGINSGRISKRLGSDVVLTGFLGGVAGEDILELLHKENMKSDFVKIKEQTRTGVTISQADGQQTRLSFQGPNISLDEYDLLIEKLEKLSDKDLVCIGGSLPNGVSTSCVKKLIKKLNSKGIKCFVDMPGLLLKGLTQEKLTLIKPNLIEFNELTSKNCNTIADVLQESEQFLSNIEYICVSSVEGGALLISNDQAVWGKIPKIEVKSTVGAGDSMVGAMTYYLQETKKVDLTQMLRIGLAASAATLCQVGTTLGAKKDIDNFINKIIIKNIK
jgi:1-phosphofructokinase family hexose kinase